MWNDVLTINKDINTACITSIKCFLLGSSAKTETNKTDETIFECQCVMKELLLGEQQPSTVISWSLLISRVARFDTIMPVQNPKAVVNNHIR